MREAPGLREVAEIWWDVDRDPVVTWTEGGRAFWLVDPQQPDDRLALARFATAVADPERIAATLAEGLASCDFPPTGQRAAPGRVAATLRVAGVTEVLAADQDDP